MIHVIGLVCLSFVVLDSTGAFTGLIAGLALGFILDQMGVI